MTHIINLYGGPGIGKSTFAAQLFSRLKMSGLNVELVRESAKDWAWEKRDITPYSQLYLMGRQIRRESMLLGKVSHIITDAPVMLYDYYAGVNSPGSMAVATSLLVKAYYQQLVADGHIVTNLVLVRASRKYNPSGRYQIESEARAMDDDIVKALHNRSVSFHWASAEESSVRYIAEGIELEALRGPDGVSG